MAHAPRQPGQSRPAPSIWTQPTRSRSHSASTADKEPVWKSLARKHGLLDLPYEQVASWYFGDAIFYMEYDNITSTINARRAGFHDCIDTEAMFLNFFEELRRRKVIPPEAK